MEACNDGCEAAGADEGFCTQLGCVWTCAYTSGSTTSGTPGMENFNGGTCNANSSTPVRAGQTSDASDNFAFIGNSMPQYCSTGSCMNRLRSQPPAASTCGTGLRETRFWYDSVPIFAARGFGCDRRSAHARRVLFILIISILLRPQTFHVWKIKNNFYAF